MTPPETRTMGLTIKIAPEFALSHADDRGVALPGVTLVPTPENLPHVTKFEVEVVGSSTQLHQGEVYRVAELLKAGYPKLEYRPGKEVALRQQMTVPLNRVVLDSPIPAGARFALTVQVWYCDSDAQGRPNTSAGVKGPVKGTSILTPGGPAAYAAPTVGGPCRVEVEPAHLTLVDRGEPAALTVRTSGRPGDLTPRLVLGDAFHDAPPLGAALAALLTTPLRRQPDGAAGWETWRAELALQLEPEARRLLWERSQGGPLEVGARAEVPGRAACELTLRLLAQEDVFKGLIAIDFGTSNSTVTLYDPGVVEDLTGLAPEQEARLKELLLTELMDDDGSCKLTGADAQAWRGLIERVGGNLAGDAPTAERFRSALRAGGQRIF
jgi:hypothetical protein